MTFAFISAGIIVSSSLISQNIWASPVRGDNADLKKIQEKITASSKRAQKYEQETVALDQEITSLRQRLVMAAQKIQTTEADVYEKKSSLKAMDAQQIVLEKNLKSRYGQMAKTLGAMERLSQQPPELVPYRPEKAIDSLRSTTLLKILHPKLKERARAIKEDIVELHSLRAKITAEQQELEELLLSLNTEQIEMNSLLKARHQKQQELRKKTKKERLKLKQFAAKAQNLQDLIAKIEQEAKERENAARAAAARIKEKPTLGQKPNIPNTEKLKVARSKRGSGHVGTKLFSNAKGHLPLPARGSIRLGFGRKTPEGLSSEGIIIHTLPQATVIAPYEGRIVFAGKFRTYGQLLIIAHGQKYHTLLAGMTRLDAEVGQWVLQGEPIGQMSKTVQSLNSANKGSDQISTGQNLYVELRKRGKPINPLPWIVASDRKVF